MKQYQPLKDTQPPASDFGTDDHAADHAHDLALAADAQASSALRELSVRRTRRVMGRCLAAMIGVAVLGAVRVATGNSQHIAALGVLLLGVALLGVQWLLSSRQPDRLSPRLFLGVLAATVCGCAVFGRGPYDLAILAMPTLIVVAAVTFKPRDYRWMLALVLLCTGTLAVTTALGIAHYELRAWSIVDAAAALLILLVTGIAIEPLVRDVRRQILQVHHTDRVARSAAADAHHAAHHDTLTGLPNRNMAVSVGENLIKEAHQAGERVALLLVARQDLALLNESLGHDAGDELILHSARQLLAAGDGHFLARIGGNEFLLLMRGVRDTDTVATLAQTALDAVDGALMIQGVEVTGATACGIAIYPEDAQGFAEMLRTATRASKEAAAAGGSTYRFFNEAMHLRTAEHVSLMADLRAAIRDNGRDFWLAYQPKVQLATGRLTGLEALLRWDHARLGRIPPSEIIEIAEASGHIVELGSWVLERACRDAASWTAPALRHASVAVNVSAVQFLRCNMADVVRDVLLRAGLAPERLVIEVTESLFVVDSDQLHQTLQRLRAMGVRLAIDDFGTGYSNLGYLQRFDVDTLKVDRSFVSRVEEDDKNAVLVRAIISMARALNMEVVAEGVESQPVALTLLKMGCHTGQGYLWSEPLRLEDLLQRWGREGAGLTPAEPQLPLLLHGDDGSSVQQFPAPPRPAGGGKGRRSA